MEKEKTKTKKQKKFKQNITDLITTMNKKYMFTLKEKDEKVAMKHNRCAYFIPSIKHLVRGETINDQSRRPYAILTISNLVSKNFRRKFFS
jgi:hypothetical protein